MAGDKILLTRFDSEIRVGCLAAAGWQVNSWMSTMMMMHNVCSGWQAQSLGRWIGLDYWTRRRLTGYGLFIVMLLSSIGKSFIWTRKLSYRKDGRAMRPMYECPENFRESLTMPTVTFPEIFNGLFFRLMLWILPTKLEVRSFAHSWDSIWGTQKLGSPSIRPPSLFSKLFNVLWFGWTL